MSCCACCCFYPKYKRKVDNIYPRSYELPLVKIEVEKLQYYVRQHPEKLSKIGEYLYQHLKWGLNGSYKNRNYVKNTVEAVEKILSVITPQNLNYYASNYLKMIQKLLEQGATGINNDPAALNSTSNANSEYLEYQKLAADLFRKFCEKEAANQSTSNYNLNYDTFVCQFSSMCYNNNKIESDRAEIRSSGLKCLVTMVNCLVPDDSLRATYLWDNMNKIVPALLYIMHEKYLNGDNKLPANDEDELNEELKLVRYLDGDFFTHSRTNQNLNKDQSTYQFDYDGEVIINNKNDLDGITIEYIAQRKPSGNIEPGSAIGSGKDSTKSRQSSADENNAMLQRKYSDNMDRAADPDHQAKMLLKHLACKADYTTISKIVKPILDFLDTNKANGWECAKFVRCIFLILMYNVKQQHAIVIKDLVKHLDSHINSSAKLKCQIIGAISTCIRTAAMHSVGTTGQILEIFTYLIKHLKSSVEKTSQLRMQLLQKVPKNSSISALSGTKTVPALLTNTNGQSESSGFKLQSDINEEQNLQTKIIDAMGQFTVNLPDYSKSDVVRLISTQISSQQYNYTDLSANNFSAAQQNAKDQLNTQLRVKYFECLYEICVKYKPTQLFSAFINSSLLEDILKMTLVADWASSRKAHEIIQLLIDKNQMLDKIKKLKPSLFNDFNRGIVNINNKLSKSSTSILNNKENTNKSTTSLNKTVLDQQHQQSVKSSLTSLSKQTRNQTFLSQLDLNDSKFMTSREDVLFMRKNGRILLGHLNENLFLLNNRRENFESIYVTTCLIIIGLFNENEFLIDLIRFGFHVQELALLNHEHTPFSFNLQCNVHKFVCAYFLLLAKSSGIEALYEYCSQICEKRKKRGLYHYIYPEFILLETPTMTDSGIHSTRTSTTELELEFKRELTQSAKEYTNSIDEHQKNKINESTEPIELNNQMSETSEKTLESTSTVNLKTAESKMASWLFCKKTIADILDKAGFQTVPLFNQTKDFSLSFSYLQQSIKTVHTALKYRSPYSNSFDSLSNIRHESSSQNISSMQGHSRINSKSGGGGIGGNVIRESPSFHGTTPRRSLDNESIIDDDTSYDSMSQVSIDQNYDSNKLFYIDAEDANHQLTVDSLNFLKQQYLQQLNSQDLTSFEAIKRVLFNGNNNTNRTSAATSLVAGSGANGTILAPSASGVSSTSMNRNMQVPRQQSTGGFVNDNNNSSNDDQESNKSTDTLENSMKIISDFKQKPFDELKQTLLRSNQTYLNTERYQQVFDSIHQTNVNQLANGLNNIHNQSNSSSVYGSNNNLNDSIGNNSASSANGAYKETFQQKTVTLNDIDFPQLFMY